MTTLIVWFRRDLRLSDNAPLSAAAAGGGTVVPVALRAGSDASAIASEAWRRRSLKALDASLRAHDSALIMREGPAPAALKTLAAECGALAVHCSRDWTPQGLAEEAGVREALSEAGIALVVAEGQLLVPPTSLSTREGTPYRVFAPFFRAWLGAWSTDEPLPAPVRVPRHSHSLVSTPPPAGSHEPVDALAAWSPGERAALQRLEEFAAGPALDYEAQRDTPGVRGTSELSPRLAFGEVSPRQVVHALARHPDEVTLPFIRQLAWREFAYHVLHHFPSSAMRPLRSEFEEFPWRDDDESLAAWKAGETGYPLVDAGMRQLARTGWMHNRVRLVCGSFLTKDLLVPWQTGEAYFREHLVDYDPAVNPFNWQWVAGSGADAAPYFRIFNPTTQQRRFDSNGSYVDTWAPAGTVAAPRPIVDHAEARRRALAAYQSLRRSGRPG